MSAALSRCGLLLIAVFFTGVARPATFVVANKDTAGFGLNDAASFTPVGGNNASTLGQARLNVIKEAARIWGSQITSAQNIVIDAQFAAQTCTTTSGTLASAGPLTYFTGGALPRANVLYPAALAHALTGPDANSRDDINMTINSNVGTGPACLNGRFFYLGLDHLSGSNIDLLNTLLHEIGHGLGFVSLTDQNGVSGGGSRLSVFDQFICYETTGKCWPNMTNAERATASTSNGALVWNGPAVNAQLGRMVAGLSNPGGHLRLYAPTTWDSGSSVSHWDPVAMPDLLMEPFLRPNPQGATDMTPCVLGDIGWTVTSCPELTGFNVPLATAQTVATVEDTPVQLTLHGTDPDTSGPLTYAIVAQPTRGVLSTSASPSSSNGVLYTYTPLADANGTDSFTFQVSDGTKVSIPATVTINVAAVNDAPVAASQAVAVTRNTAIAITLSAADVDSPTLSYTVLSGPSNGTLSGTAPNLIYTPSAGFLGTDSFTFRASDGALNSATASVTISVVGTNPPQADSQSLSATTAVPVNVLLTAHDPDGDSLSYAVLTGPTNGTLSGTAPNLTYTSTAGFIGSDSFTFRANDGVLNSAPATVSITVLAQPAVSAGSAGSSGGGGAIDWSELALLASLAAGRLRLRRAGFGARRPAAPNS